MNEINLSNEEDIKIKIIIPFLSNFGFKRDDLDFEKSFSIKVGKYTYRINDDKEVRQLTPRLDILVKYQGENICVFEIKSDKIKIDKDDIDQAVSYGRLVNPIAPFCVISNGKDDAIMIDTIEGKEISSEKLKKISAGGYQVTLPDTTLYESIKHFFGYSKENLLKLCSNEIKFRMRTLKGSSEERYKKYIPEIYEPNEKLQKVFNDFVQQSQKHCFALVANSGMGKSCWISNLAENLISLGRPTLFFRANDIQKGIFETIIDELNWELAPTLEVAEGMKRFFDIFKEEQVFILIDGLDEINSNLVRQVIKEFLNRISGRKIVLVTTCRAEIWPNLLIENGIPTVLSEEVQLFYLTELENNQYYRMINKYKKFYNVDKKFHKNVLEDCKRNPFLLRVMFEGAASDKIKYFAYTSSEFYKIYYEKKLEYFKENKESIKAILQGIGKVLYESNKDYSEIEVIREKLHLSIMEQIPIKLYELNILEHRENQYGEECVGFYFSKFRDYVIAFYVLKLQKKCSEALLECIDRLDYTKIELSVFELYYTVASIEHKRVFDKEIYQNIFTYVSDYENIWNRNFPYIKELFISKMGKKIGFVGYFNLKTKCIQWYGFREINVDDPKVLLIPDSGNIKQQSEDNLVHLYGVRSMHMKSVMNGFMQPISKKIIIKEIFDELQKKINIGGLNESQNKALLQEELFEICYSWDGEFFNINKQTDRIKIPIDIGEMKKKILFERALRIKKDELIEEKKQSGKLETFSYGKYEVFYEPKLLKGEMDILREESLKIANRGEFLYSPNVAYVDYDEFETNSINKIEILKEMGEVEINDPVVNRIKLLNYLRINRNNSNLGAKYVSEYIMELYKIALKEYYSIVEKNFPTLKNYFNSYNEKSTIIIIYIYGDREQNLHYKIDICKSKTEKPNIVSVDYNIGINDDNKIVYEGVVYENIRSSMGYASMFIYPMKVYLKRKKYRGELLSIRSLVYNWVLEDFNSINLEEIIDVL